MCILLIIIMIHYTKGNILDSSAVALVNTVNLVGVMGKGIALQFKEQFPNNYKLYQQACRDKTIGIGKLFVTREQTIFGEKIVINFPTKVDWRKPAEYSFISSGLDDLVRIIDKYQISSIALPPLGAGNGGLNWEKVKRIIEDKIGNLTIDITIYEPTTCIVEKMKSERVALTPARTLLLYVLFDLVRHGEYISEFSSEKICYFLQRFGASDLFNLKFSPRYYGPYSGKVKYVLYALNGSYIMGYSDMDKKPFESLSIVVDSYNEIQQIINADKNLLDIATKTRSFLEGFYSDFALELLSSVDYIMCSQGKDISTEDIYQSLSKWSHRKGELFSNPKFIDIAKRHLLESNLAY